MKINLLSDEAFKTSEIEGEILNRDSLQSSLLQNFGLSKNHTRIPPAEKEITDMMIDLYENFSQDLNHETLLKWHKMLINGRYDLQDIGRYRSKKEPMQLVSGPDYKRVIHFEAPDSKKLAKEMDRFIAWFNNSGPKSTNPIPALARAGIAHLYFVSIHPFEDGNGRISRALAIKALSQTLNQPILTSLSTIIQSSKKNIMVC